MPTFRWTSHCYNVLTPWKTKDYQGYPSPFKTCLLEICTEKFQVNVRKHSRHQNTYLGRHAEKERRFGWVNDYCVNIESCRTLIHAWNTWNNSYKSIKTTQPHRDASVGKRRPDLKTTWRWIVIWMSQEKDGRQHIGCEYSYWWKLGAHSIACNSSLVYCSNTARTWFQTSTCILSNACSFHFV